MSKFQEWKYQYADNGKYPFHVRMHEQTMCGLSDTDVVKSEGPFRMRKAMRNDDRKICKECGVEFKAWLSKKYPMLEGWV